MPRLRILRIFLCLAATGLISACVPGGQVGGEETDLSPLPPKFSLLELGRRLSGGGVDIFDPWVPTLQITPLPKRPPGIVFRIPKHDSMIWRDPGVEVYSLAGFSRPPEQGDGQAVGDAGISFTPPTSLTGAEADGVIEREPLLP